MQEVLIQKFHRHLRHHHPDLLIALQEDMGLAAYLREAVAAVDGRMQDLLHTGITAVEVEEQCITALVQTLPPSKYDYLKEVVATQFPQHYETLLDSGTLTTELLNLITFCDPVFEGLGFSKDNEEDRYLRYAVIGTVDDYFKMAEEVKEK